MSILTETSWRHLRPGQRSELCIMDVTTGDMDVVATSEDLVLEAPNWNPRENALLVNARGGLYRVGLDDGGLTAIDTPDVDDHNNDHLIAHDGQTIYTSSELSGHVYAVPWAGGPARRLSRVRDEPFGCFLQGLSPDGNTLSFVGADRRPGRPFACDLYEMPAEGGRETRLTHEPYDSLGCDYSPDGAWMFFNSERDAERPGHMQLYRMRRDGGSVERLVRSDHPDWFPRVSPTGDWLVFVRFPIGAVGHVANVEVRLMRARLDGSETTELTTVLGGQGTMNVTSWAPDGRRFAFMRYPMQREDGR